MKKQNLSKILKIILTSALAVFLLLVVPVATPSSSTGAQQIVGTTFAASGKSKEQVCAELKKLDPTACQGSSSAILQSVVKPIIQVLIIVVGGVSVLVIVLGGLLYVISAGDANTTKRAKDAILYAVVGLVVAIFAQAIVSFVIGAVG